MKFANPISQLFFLGGEGNSIDKKFREEHIQSGLWTICFPCCYIWFYFCVFIHGRVCSGAGRTEEEVLEVADSELPALQ